MDMIIGLAETRLEELTPQALERFVSAPRCELKRPTKVVRRGAVVFDSWAAVPPSQLRDVGLGWMRRLCLEARSLTLEIVALRRQADWQFTARVYESGRPSSRWVLRAGRRRIAPRSMGFIQWTSVAQPRVLRLESATEAVAFEEIGWAQATTR